MNIAAVTYEYDPAQNDLLVETRPVHREFLKGLLAEDQLLASGPTADGRALLIVRAEAPEAALALLEADPLNGVGVIAERKAFMWNPVLGPWAE